MNWTSWQPCTRRWLAVKVAAHLWPPVHPKPNAMQGTSRRKLVMEVIFFWRDGVMVEIYTSLLHLMVLCSPHVWPTCGVRCTLCVLVCKWIWSGQVDLAHGQVTLYTAHLRRGAAAFLPLSRRCSRVQRLILRMQPGVMVWGMLAREQTASQTDFIPSPWWNV